MYHSLTVTLLQLLQQWPSSYNLIHSFRRTCVCVCGPDALWKHHRWGRGGALSDFVTSVVSSHSFIFSCQCSDSQFLGGVKSNLFFSSLCPRSFLWCDAPAGYKVERRQKQTLSPELGDRRPEATLCMWLLTHYLSLGRCLRVNTKTFFLLLLNQSLLFLEKNTKHSRYIFSC